MSVQITDEGTNIRYNDNAGKEFNLAKEGMAVSTYDLGIWIKPEGKQSHRIVLTDVTVPAGLANVDALRDAVLDMIAAGSSPAESGTLTNGSGSVAVLNVSQQIFAANTTRKYLLVQNLAATDIYINLTDAADIDVNSIKLLPDGQFVTESNFIPTGAVNVIGAVGGEIFIAKEG